MQDVLEHEGLQCDLTVLAADGPDRQVHGSQGKGVSPQFPWKLMQPDDRQSRSFFGGFACSSVGDGGSGSSQPNSGSTNLESPGTPTDLYPGTCEVKWNPRHSRSDCFMKPVACEVRSWARRTISGVGNRYLRNFGRCSEYLLPSPFFSPIGDVRV
jgi:hypothetical protein